MSDTGAASRGVGQAFLAASRHRVAACHEKLTHCLAQLTDQQIWWRPGESRNSIGNIVLHLCGNLRQWLVSGVGEAPDVRDRRAEFAERGPISRDELLRRLGDIARDCDGVLFALDDAVLLEPRAIQGFSETVLSAIFECLGHLCGHTQEVVYITRLQLGDGYKFAWVPTPEQGGPLIKETVPLRDAAFADLSAHPLKPAEPGRGLHSTPPAPLQETGSTSRPGSAPPVESLHDYVRDLEQEFQDEQDEGKL
jgi:Protein of unknown function (DUF1572)